MNKRKNLLKFALSCCFMVSCSGEALDSGSEPVTTPDEYFISQDDALLIASGNGLKDYQNLPSTRSAGDSKVKEIKTVPDFNNKTAFMNWGNGGTGDGCFFEDDESNNPMGIYYVDRKMIKNLRKP